MMTFPSDHQIIIFYYKDTKYSSKNNSSQNDDIFNGVVKLGDMLQKAGVSRINLINYADCLDTNMYAMYSFLPRFDIEVGLYKLHATELRARRSSLLYSQPITPREIKSKDDFRGFFNNLLENCDIGKFEYTVYKILNTFNFKIGR